MSGDGVAAPRKRGAPGRSRRSARSPSGQGTCPVPPHVKQVVGPGPKTPPGKWPAPPQNEQVLYILEDSFLGKGSAAARSLAGAPSQSQEPTGPEHHGQCAKSAQRALSEHDYAQHRTFRRSTAVADNGRARQRGAFPQGRRAGGALRPRRATMSASERARSLGPSARHRRLRRARRGRGLRASAPDLVRHRRARHQPRDQAAPPLPRHRWSRPAARARHQPRGYLSVG